ncbi:MAG: hypothetical protein H5U15_03010 [Roseovarius sp.]|nr:hypothetical protein [Roseovarius sp.]
MTALPITAPKPALSRRGLFRKDYAGTTLRENLGLSLHGARPIGMAAE